MLTALVVLAALAVLLSGAGVVLGVLRERRLMACLAEFERVGILVTPDPKLKEGAVPMRMSPRQKIKYVEEKLHKRALVRRGVA